MSSSGSPAGPSGTLIKEGDFYLPAAKTAEARLQFYASQFPIVEVDSIYYFPEECTYPMSCRLSHVLVNHTAETSSTPHGAAAAELGCRRLGYGQRETTVGRLAL